MSVIKTTVWTLAGEVKRAASISSWEDPILKTAEFGIDWWWTISDNFSCYSFLRGIYQQVEEYTKLGPNFSHRIQQSEYSPEWQEAPNQDTQHNAISVSIWVITLPSKRNEEVDSIAPNTHEKNKMGFSQKMEDWQGRLKHLQNC